MRVVSTIPKNKARAFTCSINKELSGDSSCSPIDKIEKLNQKLKGWSQFYCHTGYTAQVYNKIDRAVF
ncbi:group II intron maturase-specific domain-containing protein [Vibrio alginolyticus]|uniref:group II intron maturase-specific domain-containing protein n=1 Tax=Vibrio alginolyticus TaxID=663 RepID=UPI003A4C693D